MEQLLDKALGLGYYIAAFVVILSIIVFIHEYGHYIIAKWCGVKIEEFSIGFGKEIAGFNDKSGTRWKFCIIPMGGYVKMFGDINPASAPDKQKLQSFTAEEEKVTFHGKPLWQKALVVSGGPLANFLLAIVILTGFIMVYGKPSTLPLVNKVMVESAADKAGILPGDLIIRIDGEDIEDFSDIQTIVSINTGTPIRVTYMREEQEYSTELTPQITESKDIFGNNIKRALIGIQASQNHYSEEKVNIFYAVGLASAQTYTIALTNLKAIGQIIVGDRTIKDLGGPVKIAKYSGQAAKKGLHTVLWFMVMVSIGLGLINLFPIPVLDGGHLMYYAIEALQGKPLAEKYQEYGMKAGMVFLLAMVIVVTFNDVKGLFE